MSALAIQSKSLIGGLIENDISTSNTRQDPSYNLAVSIAVQHARMVRLGINPLLHSTFQKLSSIKAWMATKTIRHGDTICFAGNDFLAKQAMVLDTFDRGFFNSHTMCLTNHLAMNDGKFSSSPTFRGPRYKLGKFNTETEALIACQRWKIEIAQNHVKLRLLVPVLKAGLKELKARL